VGVAVGYLHAPDLTADKFLRNPFSNYNSNFVDNNGSNRKEEIIDRVYRTGDIVKQLPGGEYVFVRRMDDQVKIDGYRIELGEVEAVVMQQVEVEQAVALVRRNQIVLYMKLVSSEMVQNGNLESQEWQQEVQERVLRACKQALTHYMVPKHWVIVESFPQTANGKIDKKALPDPPSFLHNPGTLTPTSSSKVSSSKKNEIISGMLKHVLTVLEQSRGTRPSPDMSLAGLGLDSLGSVLLLRALSSSLQGLRIDPKVIYGPGSTARTLARYLLTRLDEENPSLRETIQPSTISPLQTDIEDNNNNNNTGEEYEVVNFDGSETDNLKSSSSSAAEMAFEESLAANARLLQGMRGLFTLFVLWDHYHAPLAISTTFTGDTSFFVLLSGFTTSLQLRSPPTFASSTTSNDTTLMLQPRPPFQWKSFLLTRAIGIFPILWLALLLNAPFWYLQDTTAGFHSHHLPGLQQDTTNAVCTMLYVVGMQSWYRPQCHHSGPNNVLYASIILNCFLLYALLRWLLQIAQNRVIEGLIRSRSPPPQPLPCSLQDCEHDSLRASDDANTVIDLTSDSSPPITSSLVSHNALANALLRWSYNRPPLPGTTALWGFTLVTAFFASLPLLCFGVLDAPAKNAFIFLPFFLAGVTGASLTEVWFYSLWGSKGTVRRGNDVVGGYEGVGQTAADEADLESEVSLDQRLLLQQHYQQQQRHIKQWWCQSYVANSRLKEILWMGSADLLAILCCLLMSTLDVFYKSPARYLMQWLIVPWVLQLYMSLALLQVPGVAPSTPSTVHVNSIKRWSVSRRFLESSVMNLLGYISYPMYLFQRSLLEWWAPRVAASIAIGSWQWELDEKINGISNNRGDSQWFTQSLNFGWRFLAVVLLAGLCWCVQKFFQDGFVLWFYGLCRRKYHEAFR